MHRFVLAACLLFGLGCKQSTEPVSNAATDYTKSLQQDVTKAQEAAEKANAAIADEQKAAMEAATAGE